MKSNFGTLEKYIDEIGVGTGLGLSISYGIVQRHGGRIEADSTLPQGSCFKIILPGRQSLAA